MQRLHTKAPSLKNIYHRMFRSLGRQHWWPAEDPFEIMVGALLTQGCSWRNVERAIGKLKEARALSANILARLPAPTLHRLIRCTGYFRQKAKRLQTFSRWYEAAYRADARRMFRTDRTILRRKLLEIPGIGPETADSILLYAGNQPVFVVDAYTRRIFSRHLLIEGEEPYDTIQRLVLERLPEDPRLLNEFHALLVAMGKRYCRRRDPDCACCPLGSLPRNLEATNHG